MIQLAQSARAQRVRALRALGLLLADSALTVGRGGVWIPPKSDDVIYEQPLTILRK